MIPRTVYLETPLWNELCDQGVDADWLLNALQERASCIVISTQLVCELAGTFKSTRFEDPFRRGRQLFSYLQRFTTARIPCLKMNNQLLQDEALLACGLSNGFNALLSTADYDQMVAQIEKLSNGVFEPIAEEFLKSRKALARDSRTEVREFVSSRPELRSRCSEVSFGEFIRSVHPIDRFKVLRGHLSKEFPDTELDILNQVTTVLLRYPGFRVAHAMLRADMYTTWRTACAGSLARDVQDDCYHLVNSSYCDVYATKDKPQSQYAPDVLRPAEFRFYDGNMPLSDWLVRIATE
jgi:hypothetical protein